MEVGAIPTRKAVAKRCSSAYRCFSLMELVTRVMAWRVAYGM